MQASFIPVFPLQIVVFEEEELRLHIFEPRYKRLIQECISSDTVFGIPSIIDERFQNTGCTVNIQKLERTYENGEMDIVCKAEKRFDIVEFLPSVNQDTASGALVQFIPFIHNEDKELNLRLTDLLNELMRMNHLDFPTIEAADFIFYHWVHKCGLGLHKEMEMAHLQTTYERQLYLLEHLKNLVTAQDGIQAMVRMIQLNGHFKKLPQSF